MKVLIIGHVWPEPQSSAAGSRMMQLMEVFINQGYDLHFASTAQRSSHSSDLETLHIKNHEIKLNDSGFDAFAKALNPQIVVYDRFMVEEQFGWRIAENCPDALRVLDTEDLHGLRNARWEAHKKKQPFTEGFLVNDMAKREIASIYRCDLSLIISEFEMELLQNFFGVPKKLLVYLPFMVEEIGEAETAIWKPFEERIDFMTIGNFKHLPNYDGVLYLKEAIWPFIRKELPQAKLHIYGAYPTGKVEQLHNAKEGFLIEGHVKNSRALTENARVCLAALRIGAGLKGKILEAMQCGTPCVTTPIGAEGMFGNLPFNGTVADNAKKFATAAIELYSGKEKWQKGQENGSILINNRFLMKKWSKVLIEKLEKTSAFLMEHRLQNFTGAMLMHHSLQATKFMSKWIEAKNK
ncbi:MAG TPA: glycosyltransferase [Leeuwenhoekiella sp.]|nr:glycosyltransferase [Leeuwenhoekiella sp.]